MSEKLKQVFLGLIFYLIQKTKQMQI